MIDSTRIPCAFILTLRRPLRSTLFPYTTLFRSRIARAAFMRYVFTALIALSLCLSPFLGATPAGQTQGGSMKIVSSAFSANEMIPKKFTCDGPDASPKLSWNEPPAKTQSFALIMDDPDAPVGTWVHWVLFDLPADTRELAEGVAKQEQLANRARQGRNDFGQIGYGGPCPPRAILTGTSSRF